MELSLSATRRRLADSAIEYGLNAFWTCIAGVALMALLAIWGAIHKAPSYLIGGFIGALLAFLVTAAGTATLTWYARRRKPIAKRVGRKGVFDYRYQAELALKRVNKEMVEMTEQVGLVAKIADAGSKQMNRARTGWRASTERQYRTNQHIGEKLAKRASILRIHVDRFASDAATCVDSLPKYWDWAIRAGRDSNELHEEAEILDGLAESVISARKTTEDFRRSVEQNRELSESLDIAGGELVDALDVYLASSASIVRLCDEEAAKLRLAVRQKKN
jgi:hypothetical protein